MEFAKTKTTKLLAIIIAISAIGMMVLKYPMKENTDSFIMPFILLCLSVIMYFQKPKQATEKVDFTTRKGKIIFSALSFAIISGIVVYFITIL